MDKTIKLNTMTKNIFEKIRSWFEEKKIIRIKKLNIKKLNYMNQKHI